MQLELPAGLKFVSGETVLEILKLASNSNSSNKLLDDVMVNRVFSGFKQQFIDGNELITSYDGYSVILEAHNGFVIMQEALHEDRSELEEIENSIISEIEFSKFTEDRLLALEQFMVLISNCHLGLLNEINRNIAELLERDKIEYPIGGDDIELVTNW